jgi:hypothetical protein
LVVVLTVLFLLWWRRRENQSDPTVSEEEISTEPTNSFPIITEEFPLDPYLNPESDSASNDIFESNNLDDSPTSTQTGESKKKKKPHLSNSIFPSVGALCESAIVIVGGCLHRT